MSIEDNLKFVCEDINNTLEKLGRSSKDVKLISVTKNVDPQTIQEALNVGITDIGENRVQELEKKMEYFGNKINYHMIGHLQTNKVKYIIDRVRLIHSLDRLSLAKELNKRAKKQNLKVETLIQVNIAGEKSKFGLSLEEVVPFIESILKFENINVQGLMTIAPHTDDTKVLRDVFRKMHNLKEDIQGRNYKGIDMNYLSMGMSNDYKIAIEEGSNMVRIGSSIFGKRKY